MCRIIVLGELMSVHYHVIVSMSKNDARGSIQLLLICCVITDSIITIMYIYHVFINALSALRSSGFSVDKEAHHNASASS